MVTPIASGLITSASFRGSPSRLPQPEGCAPAGGHASSTWTQSARAGLARGGIYAGRPASGSQTHISAPGTFGAAAVIVCTSP